MIFVSMNVTIDRGRLQLGQRMRGKRSFRFLVPQLLTRGVASRYTDCDAAGMRHTNSNDAFERVENRKAHRSESKNLATVSSNRNCNVLSGCTLTPRFRQTHPTPTPDPLSDVLPLL